MINYGQNKMPEYLTVTHEETGVAMGHGYFKVEGKPLAVMAHGTVGLQHAAMAIYNAWCDRVPVYIILGNYADAATRRGAEWYHGVQDAAAMVSTSTLTARRGTTQRRLEFVMEALLGEPNGCSLGSRADA